MNRDDVTALRQQKRTRQQALVERNKLMDDKDFAKLVSDADGESIALVAQLAREIVGTPEAWSKPPENFGRSRDDVYGERAEQP